jgi:hypothetical protein
MPPVAPPPLHGKQQVSRSGIPRWVWWLSGGLVMALMLAGALVLLLGGLVSSGWGMFTEQAQAALQEQPVVRERIGRIQEMDLDFIATGNAPGSEEFVFRVRGDRGHGTVQATFVSVGSESEVITEGTLRMSDGRRYPLAVEDETDATEEPESP